MHISEDQWMRFHKHQLTPDEELLLLNHVCECDFCSSRMANTLPAEEQLSAPRWMKQETIQYVQKHTLFHRLLQGPKLQLFFYSLRVGVAVAFALLLLVHIDFTNAPELHTENRVSLTGMLLDGSNQISDKLYEFSTSLVQKEVIHNEKSK